MEEEWELGAVHQQQQQLGHDQEDGPNPTLNITGGGGVNKREQRGQWKGKKRGQ